MVALLNWPSKGRPAVGVAPEEADVVAAVGVEGFSLPLARSLVSPPLLEVIVYAVR